MQLVPASVTVVIKRVDSKWFLQLVQASATIVIKRVEIVLSVCEASRNSLPQLNMVYAICFRVNSSICSLFQRQHSTWFMLFASASESTPQYVLCSSVVPGSIFSKVSSESTAQYVLCCSANSSRRFLLFARESTAKVFSGCGGFGSRQLIVTKVDGRAGAEKRKRTVVVSVRIR